MNLSRLSICFLFIVCLFWQTASAQPQSVSEETKTLVRSNTDFGLAAYAKMSSNDGNVFFSPFSLSAALAMAYGGAKGETAKQIARVLHLNPNQKNVHAEMAALLSQMAVKDEQVQLFLANALWAQRGLVLLEPYQNLLHTNYNSELKTVDFSAHARIAAAAINQWSQHNTNGRITNIAYPNSFTKDTLLLLTNVIYFKARWQKEFWMSNTKIDDFWVGEDLKTSLQMMYKKSHFPYFDSDDFQILTLPYKSRYSMVIVLPKARTGLVNIEKQLTAVALEKWLVELQSKEVEVFFPKFELEVDLSLKTLLANLGMPLAFQDNADFSGITRYRRGIKLDKAMQKTFVKIDEEGTEAAAVTVAHGIPGGIGIPQAPPPIFRADHPFLFFIKENSTNSILFMGRFANPNQRHITIQEH